MGLFDKKIKCSYCNKSVKEDYAINVGICPHCSKRLVLPSSNSSFSSNSQSNNSYSSSSNSDNSTTRNTSQTFDTTCHHSDGTSHSGYDYSANRQSTTPPVTTNYSNNNSSGHGSTPNTAPRPQNNYQSSFQNNTPKNSGNNSSGKRPPIDSDYIRQINAEANAQRNNNAYPPRRISGNSGYNSGYNQRNVSPGPNRANIFKNETNKAGKIFLIVFIGFFILSSIIPIFFGIIGMMFFSNSDSDYDTSSHNSYHIEEDIDDYYNKEGGSYTTDADGTTYRFPTSVTMTSFLSQYFGKSVSDISYKDLCSIKGFTVDFDYITNEMCIYLYEDGGKNYSDFIENGFINIDRLNNNSQKCNISLPEGSSTYQYMNDLLQDIPCFPNLEYFESNYSFSTDISFEDCENLKAFIAPRVSLYSDSLSKVAKIEYLSIYEIEDEEIFDNLTSLKSLRLNSDFSDVEDSVVAVLDKCSKLDSLYVDYEINNSTLSHMNGIVNLDVRGITSLDNLTCYNTLETLTLRYSSLSNLTPISKFTKLTSLNINDDTITDYSSLASLSKLRALTLAPLNHDATHKVSALSSLTNLEYLSLESIDDTEFVKSLKKIRTLELSHYYDSTIHKIITSLPNLDTLTLDYVYSSEAQGLGYISSLENISELTIKDSYILTDLTELFITDSLMKLTLDGCTFYANGLNFENNNSLMYINITNCSFSDYYVDSNSEYQKVNCSIADLASNMDRFKALSTLNMEGCDLSSAPDVVDGAYVTY